MDFTTYRAGAFEPRDESARLQVVEREREQRGHPERKPICKSS